MMKSIRVLEIGANIAGWGSSSYWLVPFFHKKQRGESVWHNIRNVHTVKANIGKKEHTSVASVLTGR
jgi:hypothetical protein